MKMPAGDMFEAATAVTPTRVTDTDELPQQPDECIMLCSADGHLRSLAQIEADVIRLAISRYGEFSEAARRLGIGRSTLYRKVASLPEFRRDPGQWRNLRRNEGARQGIG